jgi:hypothetical protein
MNRIGWLAVASLVLAGACRDAAERVAHEQADDPYGQLAVTADTSRAFRIEDEPAPITAVQATPLTLTGQLAHRPGEGGAGEVTLTEEGAVTRLLLAIREFPVGTEMRVSFVRGGCADPAQVVHTDAENVRIEATGLVTIDRQVPVALRTLVDGSHSIHLTPTAADPMVPGATLACARIPEVPATY